MTKIVILLLIFLFPIISYGKNITITVLYNNVPENKNLTTAWEMSCLIEGMEKTILFDVGGEGSILLSNMKKLKVDPKQVDIIVLSHIHSDHVGGLTDSLEKNNDVVVYLPKSFPSGFKSKVQKMGAKVISVNEPKEVCKNVYSTGELGKWIKEQSVEIKYK